jgi:ketosteroid isomerase-like protein
MKTAHALIVALAVPTLIAGCAAEPPPPAVDLAAEKAAVEQVLQDQLSGASQPGQAGADGYVAVMTDDVVVLPPNAERLNGKEAVREWALQSTSAEDWSPTWAPNLVVVAASGDVAYAIGTYALSLEDADGNLISDKGKWLGTFRKQADGSWKMSALSSNSDLPVGEAEPEM